LGDGSANTAVIGYVNGHHQSHTYATAGRYTLIVIVNNTAGTARIEKDITVLGNLLVSLNSFL